LLCLNRTYMKFHLRKAIPGMLVLTALIGAEPLANLFEKSNLVAWCIVPFDAKKRGPEERAAMLERLGIRKLAYDYRDQHLPTFDQELDALTRHGIALHAFWLRTGPDPAAENDTKAVFGFIERRKLKTEIWYRFKEPRDFDTVPEARKFELALGAIRYVAERAAKSGNRVGLYNHGGWFGEPENQMIAIKKLGLKNVGMVYNFHHGHEHMDRFAKIFPQMVPYLMAVNINGMRKDGPIVLPVGQGDREAELLRVIARSKYRGPIGILGHREKEDAEVALRQNLDGLAKMRP
jgi:sugar phosphate isomerase/epimerase